MQHNLWLSYLDYHSLFLKKRHTMFIIHNTLNNFFPTQRRQCQIEVQLGKDKIFSCKWAAYISLNYISLLENVSKGVFLINSNINSMFHHATQFHLIPCLHFVQFLIFEQGSIKQNLIIDAFQTRLEKRLIAIRY